MAHVRFRQEKNVFIEIRYKPVLRLPGGFIWGGFPLLANQKGKAEKQKEQTNNPGPLKMAQLPPLGENAWSPSIIHHKTDFAHCIPNGGNVGKLA